MQPDAVARALAKAFLAGEVELEGLLARAAHALGRPWRWLRPLASRYISHLPGPVRPRYREVIAFILQDRAYRWALHKYAEKLRVEHWPIAVQPMQPSAAARVWQVPPIDSVSALADWSWLEYGDLDWMADLKRLAGERAAVPQLQHYRYRLVKKPSGSFRLIEAPKARLKKLQREILEWILGKVPAHPAAHGFVKGRSITTFAAPHVHRRIVLRMDLQDFFASIRGARIQTIFRWLGYPEAVADLLGGICTNAAPRRVWQCEALDASHLYSRRHLPQGAPTSPTLANICAYRLDCRLSGLAASAGAVYTRYADDLAFSGDESFERRAENFAVHVAVISQEEGFRLNHRKTRMMRQGVRQRLAGLVVNEHLNTARQDFDNLKAILTNCIRHGAGTQNREGRPDFRAYLAGRVAFVTMVNPGKAARLSALFDEIDWVD